MLIGLTIGAVIVVCLYAIDRHLKALGDRELEADRREAGE